MGYPQWGYTETATFAHRSNFVQNDYPSGVTHSLVSKTKPKQTKMSIEKKRPEKLKPSGGGDGSIFDAKPDAEDKSVNVSAGVHNETLPVAGMSVGEVRKRFADRFDIDTQSTSIVDGNPTDENHILKKGEALMFVRHAGEKGDPSVVIEGGWATAKSLEGQIKKMDVGVMMDRVTPRQSTGPCILPTGVKAIASRGPFTIWIWESPPCVQQFSWIAADSPTPYGQGTKYRKVKIALPYLIIMSVFSQNPAGMPQLLKIDECFFRNEPLKTMGDELHYPALLNCSKFSSPDNPNPGASLSWICTQYLKKTRQMDSKDVGERYTGCFEAVRHCLLETAFNLSSEHHEGNSWYGASKSIDSRISPIENWEKATQKDPLFALDVPWIKTHHSVKDLIERTFKRLGATDQSVKSSNDLYRVIFNG